MSYYLPTEYGAADLILDAMVDLLTLKCQTEVDTGDVSRAVTIKAGPRQAAPESVSILIHENDPDAPSSFPNRPMRYRGTKATPGMTDPYSASQSERSSPGYVQIGGGSQYTRTYVIEVEVYGRSMPVGVDMEREDVRRVTAVVTSRLTKALLEAGPHIGTDRQIHDDFGGYVVQGPFPDISWVDPEEGESLVMRKYLRFWYSMALDWSTDDWV